MTAALGMANTTLASASATGFTLASQANGLQLNLFGTQLTGGNSAACVNDGGATAAPLDANKNGDGSSSLCDNQPATYSAAEGEGTLLTSSGSHIDQKATEATTGQSDGSTNPTCSQGGASPSGTPFTVTLGVSCAYATAAVDSSGNPSSSAMGSVSDVTVGLNGILQPLVGAAAPVTSATNGVTSGLTSCTSNATLGSLLNSVCTALSSVTSTATSSAPQPVGNALSGVEQVLQNLFNVVTKNADPTITIDVGQAKSSVHAASGTLQAIAQGSSLDVSILPGVGCAAPSGGAQPTLAQCVTDATSASPQYSAPLVEIEVSPAQTGSALNGGQWVPTATGSVATVHVNIPGDQQVIPVSPGADQTILSGTPLQSSIDLGSVQTAQTADGVTSVAHGVLLDLLESSTFPGGSDSAGAISIDLDATGTSGTSGATPAAPAAPDQASPAPAVAVGSSSTPAPSPTSVHTGEWWAGSLPLVALLGALGAGLVAWPRLRRVPVVGSLRPTGSFRSLRSVFRRPSSGRP